MAFYDSNMDGNSPQDWLKLLLYATCTDKDILTKILTKTRDLDTPHQIIDYVDAEECGKNNAKRLLEGKAIAARVGLEGGGTGGRAPKCFLCQAIGHSKSECTVDPGKLWCDHCKTRKHNTYRACPKNKNKPKQPKDNPKDTKKDTKIPKLKPKGGKIRTVKNDEQNDEVPEGEDDEDDD